MGVTRKAALALALWSCLAAPASGARPISKAMQDAMLRYRDGRFHDAGALFHHVVSKKTADSKKNRQRAELWLSKALIKMGLTLPALHFLDRIVSSGPSHAFRAQALKWLVSLARQLPEETGVLKNIGACRAIKIPRALAKIRGEIDYYTGRHLYSQDYLRDAARRFHRVPPADRLYLSARFMEGVTHVRTYRARPAAAAFKDVIRAARKPPASDEKRRFKELGLLSMGRLFYSLNQHRLAIKYYDRIPKTSLHRIPAQFEKSWALFRIDDYAGADRSLARVQKAGFHGEARLLAAAVAAVTCRRKTARAMAIRLGVRLSSLNGELGALLTKMPDHSDFHAYLQRVRAGNLRPSADAKQVIMAAMNDGRHRRIFELLRTIAREQATLKSAPAAWRKGPLGQLVKQDLQLNRALARSEAGAVVRRQLQRVIWQNRSLVRQAKQIAAAAAPTCKKARARPR